MFGGIISASCTSGQVTNIMASGADSVFGRHHQEQAAVINQPRSRVDRHTSALDSLKANYPIWPVRMPKARSSSEAQVRP
jgi:hypothetical protein